MKSPQCLLAGGAVLSKIYWRHLLPLKGKRKSKGSNKNADNNIVP